MSDDLDDLLRRAMKTLDDQVPSGYFEALPDQTLARLEGSMQMSGTSESKSGQPSTTPPPEREENSGLHDIRSLAHSTKQRLSKKITAAPVPDDLAATSGAWKHVALPEPAKMVALPALDELPPAKEVRAKDKATAKAVVEEAPAAEAAIGKPAFSAWADRAPKKSKAPLYAGIGAVLVAAAAGVFFYVQNQGGSTKAAAPAVAMTDQKEAPKQAAAPATVTAEPIAQPAPPPAPADEPAAKADTTTAADTGEVAAKAETKPAKTTGHATKGAAKLERAKSKSEEQKPADKVAEKKQTTETAGGAKDGEPDFDDLLKQAGVDKNKLNEGNKPKLAKKELTADDFMNGMSAVKGKAAACYKGTQGTVSTKVYIAPSGQITKVAITGQFAGTPEGSCVQAALKGATFPPWDGGPHSFSYPILLSE